MYNSGTIQLTIEKFKRISGHQMSTSSSSLASFLTWAFLFTTVYHLGRNM
jgi:hypothetical protein